LKAITGGLLILTLALGGWWLYGKLFPGDEARIRALIATVAEKGSIQAGEGNFAKVARVNALVDCFSADVEIRLEGAPGEFTGLQGRGELQRVLQAARLQVESAEIKFDQVAVTLGPGQDQATAQVVALARIHGVEEVWVQELKLILSKAEGAWKIARVATATRSLHM
jgi:hypothetical protein